MPFAGNQTYLTFGGRLGSSVPGFDVWQCGLHLADPNSTLVPPLPTSGDLEDLYPSIAGLIGSSTMAVNGAAYLEWVKAASLNTAGEYTDEPSIYEGAGTAGGGTTGGFAPPQASIAITLFSGSTFGKANYGRFYLPWSTPSISGTLGTFSTGAAMADEAADFVAAVNTWAAGLPGALDAKVCNMSEVGSGTTKQVTAVRVGNAVDTQRRRRNAIVESYSQSAV